MPEEPCPECRGQYSSSHIAAQNPQLRPWSRDAPMALQFAAPPSAPQHHGLWFPSPQELTGIHKQGSSAEVMELAGKSWLSRTLSFPKGVIYSRLIQQSKDMVSPVCSLAVRGSPSLAGLEGSSKEGPHLPPEDPASVAAPASVCFVNQHIRSQFQKTLGKDGAWSWKTYAGTEQNDEVQPI